MDSPAAQERQALLSRAEAEAAQPPRAKRAPIKQLFRQRVAAYIAHARPDNLLIPGEWSSELWDVCGQPGGPNMCCLSLWCPCIQYGMLLEQLPPGAVTCAGSLAGGCALFCVLWLAGDLLGAALSTKFFTLPCTALVHSQARGYIRRKYGIQSHPIHDFFITWCCAPCALCQEARECVVRGAAEREGAPPSRGLRPSLSILNGMDRGPDAHPGGAALGGGAGSPAALVPAGSPVAGGAHAGSGGGMGPPALVLATSLVSGGAAAAAAAQEAFAAAAVAGGPAPPGAAASPAQGAAAATPFAAAAAAAAVAAGGRPGVHVPPPRKQV